MKIERPISCDAHDHIEVACLYRYELIVTLRDGTHISGRAKTTRTQSGGIEYLVLSAGDLEHEVPLHGIAVVDVKTANARFRTLNLG